MLCPNPACTDKQATLLVADRQGIEIDYCPHCRGIWLDRGELEKLLERLGPAAAATPAPRYDSPRDHDDYARRSPYPAHPQPSHDPHASRDAYYHKRKHKSWLGDMFDFD